MITITERVDDAGRRLPPRVSVSFPSTEKVVRRLSEDRKAYYEDFVSVSRAKPEFAKDVDINRIMAKFDKTGVIDPLLYRDMKYGDFTEGGDFAECLMRVRDAESEFLNLPADVRGRFRNDPVQLLDFLADSKNDEEAIKLGLRERPVTRTNRDPSVTSGPDGPAVSQPAAPAAASPAAPVAAAPAH